MDYLYPTTKTIYKFELLAGLTSQISPYVFVSAIIFAIAVFTDFLDGYLSRKWKVTSDFGRVYDPVADKFLILGYLAYFMLNGTMFFLIPLLLIIRDVASDVMRVKSYSKGIVIPANQLAKWKTASQMICVILILLFFNNQNKFGDGWWIISTSISLIPLVFSYVSFWKYIKTYNNQQKSK